MKKFYFSWFDQEYCYSIKTEKFIQDIHYQITIVLDTSY